MGVVCMQAMKRLGGNGGQSRQRWRKQKAADKEEKVEVTRRD